MRDLNKKIKKIFADYITNELDTTTELKDITSQSKISIGRKILNVLEFDKE